MLALDTNVVVAVLRGCRPHLRALLSAAANGGEPIIVSALVLRELAFGALVSARPDVQLTRLDEFLDAYTIEPFTAADALAAARVQADLQRRGAPIQDVDVLIAGHAVSRGWTLVTANVRDFIRIEELALLDWSDPDEPRAYGRPAAAPR